MVLEVNIAEVTESVNGLTGDKAGLAFISDKLGNFVFMEENQENAIEDIYTHRRKLC